MDKNKRYTIINTLITSIGLIVCVVSGFIPAPYGLLADGRISLIQALPGTQKIILFALPLLLFIIADILVVSEKSRLAALIAMLAGACLFALMDLSFIRSAQPFSGTLLNEAGIVMAVCGVLLYVLGTPGKSKRSAKKSKKKPQKGAAADNEANTIDDAAKQGNQALFYDGADDAFMSSLVGRDTMEFRDTLVAALREMTDAEALPASAVNMPNNTAITSAADRTPWSSDDELEALLRSDSQEIEEATIVAEPKAVTTEEIAAAAEEEVATDIPAKVESVTDFYAGLEDMFRNPQ